MPRGCHNAEFLVDDAWTLDGVETGGESGPALAVWPVMIGLDLELVPGSLHGVAR